MPEAETHCHRTGQKRNASGRDTLSQDRRGLVTAACKVTVGKDSEGRTGGKRNMFLPWKGRVSEGRKGDRMLTWGGERNRFTPWTGREEEGRKGDRKLTGGGERNRFTLWTGRGREGMGKGHL